MVQPCHPRIVDQLKDRRAGGSAQPHNVAPSFMVGTIANRPATPRWHWPRTTPGDRCGGGAAKVLRISHSDGSRLTPAACCLKALPGDIR